MLQITKQLSEATGGVSIAESTPLSMTPVARVDLTFEGDDQYADIILKGAIVGQSAEHLLEFLKEVARLDACNWTVQLQDVQIISTIGIRNLVRFARMIQTRGFALEVRGIHPQVYAAFKALQVTPVFKWPESIYSSMPSGETSKPPHIHSPAVE